MVFTSEMWDITPARISFCQGCERSPCLCKKVKSTEDGFNLQQGLPGWLVGWLLIQQPDIRPLAQALPEILDFLNRMASHLQRALLRALQATPRKHL
jgi:hypothetical protein